MCARMFFFFSSRRRHTRFDCDWSSDVCSSDLLLEVLQAQYRELGSRDDVRHVLVFENKGEVVGVSNPHPHCQIYATNFVFKTIEVEAEAQAAHLAEHGRPLFQEILAAEEADGRRLLV